MCTTFSHKVKNITQNGQNQSCDTIALKRRSVLENCDILGVMLNNFLIIYINLRI